MIKKKAWRCDDARLITDTLIEAEVGLFVKTLVRSILIVSPIE